MNSLLDREASRKELTRSLDLYRRASTIDSSSARPLRAMVVLRMKLAVGWETDPLASVAGYEEAYRELEQLPARDLEALPNRRLRASILRRLGESFSELERHDEAARILAQDVEVLDSIPSIDPSNERARWDLAIAVCSQGNTEMSRGRLPAALPYFERVLKLLAETPTLHDSTQARLAQADTLTGIGRIQNSPDKTRQGLAILRNIASHGSPHAINRVAEAFLSAYPARLRDPAFALACAERPFAASADPDTAMLKPRALRGLRREAEAVATAATALARSRRRRRTPAQSKSASRKRLERFLTSH